MDNTETLATQGTQGTAIHDRKLRHAKHYL